MNLDEALAHAETVDAQNAALRAQNARLWAAVECARRVAEEQTRLTLTALRIAIDALNAEPRVWPQLPDFDDEETVPT